MNIGITGTRSGMNEFQRYQFRHILPQMILGQSVVNFHHGDCIGVDTEAADIAYGLGAHVVCHPPEKDDLRAFNKNSEETRTKKSYFARNRNIVDESDYLFVVPRETEPQDKGGTWYTYNYGKKTGGSRGLKIIILYPDRVEKYKVITGR